MTIFHLHHPALLPNSEADQDRAKWELSSEPRNLTGHPGHAALRDFWQSQPKPDGPAARNAGADIIGNHMRSVAARAEQLNAHYDGLAREAWRLHTDGGLSWAVACQLVGIAEGTARKRAKRLELVVELTDIVERG